MSAIGEIMTVEPKAVLGEPGPVLLLAKLAGAIAGSLISVAYVLPRNKREALLRLCVGMVTGLIFGGIAGIKLGHMLGLLDKVPAFEIALMGAAVASLSAWWALGVMQRLAERWPGPFRKAGFPDTAIDETSPPISGAKGKETDQ